MKKTRAIATALVILAAFTLTTCDGFSLFDRLDYALDDDLRIVPPNPTIPITSNYNFFATGGTPPYTFEVVSGTGSITQPTPETGQYSATAQGAVVVGLTDAEGRRAEATVSVLGTNEPLRITPTSITITEGSAYVFSAAGGSAGYEFDVYSGVGSITLSGGLYTAPAVAGNAIVRLTDSVGSRSDAAVTVVVQGGPLSISPTTPTVEENSTVTFVATGGTLPYTFALPSGPGSITPLAGVYTATVPPGNAGDIATVTVTDNAATTVQTTVTIAPPAPTLLVLDPDGETDPDDNFRLGLTWTENPLSMSTTTVYEIQRAVTSDGIFSVIATVGKGIGQYEDTGLNPALIYIYKVRAKGGSVYSADSNSVFGSSRP